LYEGFGLPPLEAAYYSKPSVISDIPIFKEIYGQSAIFVNPYDLDDIEQKLVDITIKYKSGVSIDFDYESLINKYSWVKSCNQINHLIVSKLSQ